MAHELLCGKSLMSVTGFHNTWMLAKMLEELKYENYGGRPIEDMLHLILFQDR